jgi:UPF0755 protein
MTERAPRHSDRSRNGQVKRRRRTAIVVLLFAIAIVALLAAGATYLFHTGPQGREVSVTIPADSSLQTVADILARAGVVPHALAFEIRARLGGHGSQLKAGAYDLHVNEPYGALIAALVAGAKPRTIKVTIPEGFTVAQTAARLGSDIPGFSVKRYLELTRHYPGKVPVDGYRSGTTLQGLLFPATYDVLPTVTPRRFIGLQLAAFQANMTRVDMTRAAKANLTPYDVVTIASMIEREARASGDRAKIAAVIWNRLKHNMKLQIDATVLYALGMHKDALTYDDLKVASPYNTYLHYGLPPTPIDNPGLATLTAAAAPADVSYLYYVGRSDGTGPLYFSSTYSQFLKDGTRAGR